MAATSTFTKCSDMFSNLFPVWTVMSAAVRPSGYRSRNS